MGKISTGASDDLDKARERLLGDRATGITGITGDGGRLPFSFCFSSFLCFFFWGGGLKKKKWRDFKRGSMSLLESLFVFFPQRT